MTAAAPLEIWGGVECTHNRVGDRWFDQLAWSGHDARDGDIGAFGALGLSAIRYPVLWERLAPAGIHDIDWRWTDARLAALRAHGIRPIVGLVHHGSGPRGTSLLDPAFPEQLARFAGAVARRYPWITDVTPVNEPMTTARFSALYGHWYPHARSDRSFVRALVHQLRGVVLAMDAIRQVAPAARLVQTEDCGRTFATMATRAQAAHERARQQLTWDLLTGRVDDRHPLHRFLTDAGMTSDDEAFFLNARCAPDVIGLNYYLTSDRFLDERVDRYPPSTHGGNGSIAYADVEAVRARPRGIAGHAAHLLAAWRRYGRPVAVTEVHLGGSREDQMHWIVECWRAAQCARALGADVRAITAWALLGSFNWHRLVTCDAGHYEPGVFDVRAPRPRATALAGIVSALSRGEEPAHPVLAGAPWWRRADRLTYGSLVSSRTAERRASRGSAAPPQPTRAQPLLITGATGTLGRAFARVCAARGLAYRLVGRPEVDVTDARAVAAAIDRHAPWAVINTAGYVRVDSAESDVESCRRGNVVGPLTLAHACRRHGLPLVTFSSDLVFDGRKGAPYVESDPPSPLNVYGASKAEAEARVLDAHPGAMVVRTSSFFGPWDDYNFAVCAFRALDAGAVFPAPNDCTISPTYVPDLVHASLDLLIDGADGIWHLANDGALTWFEFACKAAVASGRSTDRIQPVDTSRVWSPAIRPRCTPLASDRARIMRPLESALQAFVDESRAAMAMEDREARIA